jgi:Response regulator receiver domain
MARSGSVILIVEDELLIRMDAAEAIEAAGFEVIQAGNADEAIVILTARPDIHVVFTDIQMPGSMDGLKLARSSGTAGRLSRSLRRRVLCRSKTTICRPGASSCRNPIVAPPSKPKSVLLIHLSPPWRWLLGCPLGPRICLVHPVLQKMLKACCQSAKDRSICS